MQILPTIPYVSRGEELENCTQIFDKSCLHSRNLSSLGNGNSNLTRLTKKGIWHVKVGLSS